jgi:1,4-dihydroxy-2-naphthoyl-CoA synthase
MIIAYTFAAIYYFFIFNNTPKEETMSYEEIIVEKSDQIGTITLNRPERLNAFTWTMGTETRDALLEVDNAPDLRVSILTGAGRRCYHDPMSDGNAL